MRDKRISTGNKLSTSGGSLAAARRILKAGGINALAAYAEAHNWPTRFYLDGERIGKQETAKV